MLYRIMKGAISIFIYLLVDECQRWKEEGHVAEGHVAEEEDEIEDHDGGLNPLPYFAFTPTSSLVSTACSAPIFSSPPAVCDWNTKHGEN